RIPRGNGDHRDRYGVFASTWGRARVTEEESLVAPRAHASGDIRALAILGSGVVGRRLSWRDIRSSASATRCMACVRGGWLCRAQAADDGTRPCGKASMGETSSWG